MLPIEYQSCMPSTSERGILLLCSYVQTCDPHSAGSVLTQGLHMNKLSGGPLGDATYKILKKKNSMPSSFREEEFLKFSFFIPMFKLVVGYFRLFIVAIGRPSEKRPQKTVSCYRG